jgi:PKD repeat protein
MTLTNPVTGGSWTSSNLSVALINISSGIVTGVSVGTTTITYTSTSGCFVTTIVTVSPTLATAGASFSSSGIDSSVSFVYTGTLTALDSVVWDFGDGTSDTGLLSTHTYSTSGTYTVCATAYGICWSDISCDTVTVTLPITGMSSVGVAAVKIFPNPARATLEISGLATSSVYRLQSVTGVTLQRGALHLNKETLNIDWLVPGMYILEIVDTFGYRSVFRIIKE